jgi:hypothetical protein
MGCLTYLFKDVPYPTLAVIIFCKITIQVSGAVYRVHWIEWLGKIRNFSSADPLSIRKEKSIIS